jgi:hypothetical protein
MSMGFSIELTKEQLARIAENLKGIVNKPEKIVLEREPDLDGWKTFSTAVSFPIDFNEEERHEFAAKARKLLDEMDTVTVGHKSSTSGIVSDEEIDNAWGNANFGDRTNKRHIIADTLLKYVCGYSSGHTIGEICKELGLISSMFADSPIITKKGVSYLFGFYQI